jgi:hypothetical protein
MTLWITRMENELGLRISSAARRYYRTLSWASHVAEMMFVWGTTVGTPGMLQHTTCCNMLQHAGTGIDGGLVECPFDDPSTTGDIGEQALSDAMGAAWRSVAATGTVGTSLAWPPFSVSKRETLLLTTPMPSQVTEAGGKAVDCAFWDALDFHGRQR